MMDSSTQHINPTQGITAMTTFLWQIAPELEQLRRQMDELFDGGPTPEQQPTPTWQPRAEVWESGDRYEIKLQVPGIDPSQIEIEASRDLVRIKGDRKAPEATAKPMHSEFFYGLFDRSFRLSQAVQHLEVKASYRQGILTITLPKLTAAPKHTVKIDIASPEDSGHNPGQNSGQNSGKTEPTITDEETLNPVW